MQVLIIDDESGSRRTARIAVEAVGSEQQTAEPVEAVFLEIRAGEHGPLTPDQIQAAVAKVEKIREPQPRAADDSGTPPVGVGLRVSLQTLESEHIRRILAGARNLDEAAQILGIDPATLYRKRQRLGLLRHSVSV